jgi:tRNA 2-thiouridine synthesizing protein A
MRTTAIGRTLDLRRLSALLPVAETAVEMAGMRSGELVEVLTTDRASLRDLPVWCQATGNRLLEQTEDGGVHQFCESSWSMVHGGSLSGFGVLHPGMTHNDSGALGLPGDELSAVVPAST